MMRLPIGCVLWVLVGLSQGAGWSQAPAGGSPGVSEESDERGLPDMGVGRATDDDRADLIEAMLKVRLYDEAARWCQEESRRHPPQSDTAAWWAGRGGRVAAARQLAQGAFDAADIAAAQEPIRDLLEAYPRHDRRLFLRGELLQVEFQALRHDVFAAAVNPSAKVSPDGRAAGSAAVTGSAAVITVADRAATRAVRLSTSVAELAAEVGREAASRAAPDRRGTDGAEAAFREDLAELHRRLLVRRVEVSLLGSELFPEGSEDHVAVASLAEAAATEALARLRVDSRARRELIRLRALALLRTGDAEAAERVLQTASDDAPPTAEELAVQVTIDLAMGRHDSAMGRVRDHHSGTAGTARPSLEMDLATLRVRIETADESLGGVQDWMVRIEEHHGGYARRRAEAWTLSILRSARRRDGLSPADEAAIVAAQGHDRIRQGERLRGGELLATAARLAADGEDAIRWAGEAAAALVSAGETARAADLLAEVAVAHADVAAAADSHLQAAILVARAEPPDPQRLVSMLRLTAASWPASDPAEAARRWLAPLLARRGDLAAAAETLSTRPADQITAAQVAEAIGLWRQAFRQDRPREPAPPSDAANGADDAQDRATEAAPVPAIPDLDRRFLAAVEPHLPDGPQAKRWLAAALCLVEPESLARLPRPASRDDEGDDPFLHALDRFRRSAVDSDPLGAPPPAIRGDVQWRLVRDARRNPALRRAVAKRILAWPPPPSPPPPPSAPSPSSPTATSADATEASPGPGGVDADPALTGDPAGLAAWQHDADRGELLLWLGRVSESIEAFRSAARRSPRPGEVLRSAAETLAASGDEAAARAAVPLWDQLAAGLPRGSTAWHDAKLSACESLARLGDTDEASRRARYVLLTQPPDDPTLRRRYTRFAER